MKHVALVLLASVASICGCERGVESQSAAAPVAAHASDPVADAAAFADRLRTQQDAVLGVVGGLEYTAMIKLLGVSGVEQELGGPAAADAALLGLMQKLKGQIDGSLPRRWMPINNSSSVDGALGVAQASVELMSVALSFKDLYGDGQAGKRAWTYDKSSIEFEIADGALSYSSALATSEKGLDGKFLTHMKVNVCPAADGRITLELTSKSSVSRAGGSGANITIKVVATRMLDDDARFGDIDLTTHVESATFGAHAGAFVDMDISREGTRINRRSSQATDADASNAADLARILELMASEYTEQTRSVWENGGCVKLEPRTTPSQRLKVKPSTAFSIFAAPRSKVDGSPVGGTVRGTLNGGTSLDPGGARVRADVTYSYIAPDEKKTGSRVSLESRSKRGVGKAEVAFSTEGEGTMYSAAGG